MNQCDQNTVRREAAALKTCAEGILAICRSAWHGAAVEPEGDILTLAASARQSVEAIRNAVTPEPERPYVARRT